MNFSIKATKYFCNLKTPHIKSSGVGVINPYDKDDVKEIVKRFYTKYYYDDNERLFIVGINPGRFGGGLSGIAFTDPVALRERCKIDNNLSKRKELSSKFVYDVIKKFGGVDKFFSRVFLTALYPFAIIKDERNHNYYDEKPLAALLMPEIIRNIKKQIDFGARRDFAILLGKKNAEFFSIINEEYKFFKKIIVLEHPRYVMQYKLKQTDVYIRNYIRAINN